MKFVLIQNVRKPFLQQFIRGSFTVILRIFFFKYMSAPKGFFKISMFPNRLLKKNPIKAKMAAATPKRGKKPS